MAGASQLKPSEVERRFVLGRDEAEAFVNAVAPRLALDVYDAARPISYTRTTYLDTGDNAYFRACDGPISRRVRVREYASALDLDEPPCLTGICVLELKEASGQLRAKARFRAAPEAIAHVLCTRGELPPRLSCAMGPEQALGSIRRCLRDDELAPKVTTWYRRASLSGEGGRVRITLDEGIRFCRPTELGTAGDPAEPADVLGRGPGRVVEVKYVGEPPGWLTRAMASLVEAGEFSKFRAGMQALARATALSDTARSTRPIAIQAHIQVKED